MLKHHLLCVPTHVSSPFSPRLCAAYHISQQASVSLSMVLSLLSASCRKVCVLVMSVHLGPRSRPGGGDVVKKS